MGGEEDEEEGVMPRGDSAGDDGDGEVRIQSIHSIFLDLIVIGLNNSV